MPETRRGHTQQTNPRLIREEYPDIAINRDAPGPNNSEFQTQAAVLLPGRKLALEVLIWSAAILNSARQAVQDSPRGQVPALKTRENPRKKCGGTGRPVA
ncbi:Os03g0123701 [Oryza sativa Japonica Group]|uniref:Os03g0123701 protein n=1 Tax=Oryza sativa subsp. japonica TaxID=39947 RepID=A0A0P0VSP1_ORYSJ|nr:Os03g0123701 [Oryza sativa Japonica Group]